MMGVTWFITWLIGLNNLLTKSPRPSQVGSGGLRVLCKAWEGGRCPGFRASRV